jgi:uncharacterized protein (UPF0303 family)
MDNEHELARLAEQEPGLRFKHFDLALCWELGTRLRAAAEASGASVVIEVRLLCETAFFCAMPGTTPENADWVRRKRNTVEMLQRSSYAVGRSLALEGLTLEQKTGLSERDHAAHGGSVPIYVEGRGVVGAATVSGLPQREDHEMVAAVMAELAGGHPERPVGV